MSYLFGGATSNVLSLSGTQAVAGPAGFFCGWFKPTTLTAGRGLTGLSATAFHIKIGTTTSELRLSVDAATTDGAYDTSGFGFTVNVWTFVAFFWSHASTGEASVRAWTGTLDTPPTEVTVTQTTAPVGAAASGSPHHLGAVGSGTTTSFRGLIEQCIVIGYSAADTTGQSALPVAATGSITQDEADFVRNTVAVPIWRGELSPFLNRTSLGGGACVLMNLAINPAQLELLKSRTSAAPSPVNPTITGATWNQERSGAPLMQLWSNAPTLIRR